MFKTKLFWLLSLSLTILTVSLAQTQEKKVFKFKKGEPFKWLYKDNLKLTDAQEKKFEDLDLQFEKKMIDLRADLEKSRLMKRELIKKGNFSKSDYLAAEEKIIQAENKIQMEKAKLKMDKYELLDEKQRKTFLEEDKDHLFKFNFDMDKFKEGMKIFKDNMHHILPCPPDMDDFDKELEIEIEGEEI